MTYQTPEEAVKHIQSGDRVFVHGSAATPHCLLQALSKRAHELSNVEMTAVSTLGKMDIANFQDTFYWNSLFVSENVRGWVNTPNGEYIPIFLSEISRLFKCGIIPIDVAML